MGGKAKYERIHLILLGIFAFLILFAFLITKNNGYNINNTVKPSVIESDRVDILEDGSKIYNLYPKEVDKNCNCIIFYTDNQEVYVYEEDKLIYSRKNYNMIFGHATGKALNVIEFDAGEIKIKLHPSYGNNSQASCRFYIGNGMDLLVRNIKAAAGEVIVCILLLTAGIYLTLCYFRTRKGADCSKEVINLGIIAILFGIYSMSDTLLCQLLCQNQMLILFLENLCVMFICIFSIYFWHYFLEIDEPYIYRAIIISFWSIDAFLLLLQVFNIRDINQNMWLMYGMIILSLVYFIYGIYFCHTNGINKDKLIFGISGLGIALLAILFDMGLHFSNNASCGIMTKIAIFINVIILGFKSIGVVDDRIRKIQNKTLYDKMVVTDFQSNCYNRNAYFSDVKKINGLERIVIITIRLKNLKMCNDRYGYANGDDYIQGAVSIIKRIFDEYGKIYRISGDEFCILSTKLTEETVVSLVKELLYEEKDSSYKKLDDLLGMECGCAEYDPFLDFSIDDARKRAYMRCQ